MCPGAGEDPAGNPMVGGVGFVSFLLPKPSGGNLPPRPGILALCPTSKCLFLLKSLLHLNLKTFIAAVFSFFGRNT